MAKHRKELKESLPKISQEMLDQLLGEDADLSDPKEFEATFRALKKAMVERVLGGELTAHLGYAPGEEKPEGQSNHRNGTTPKTVLTEEGEIPLDIPRDRAGTFEPQFVPKNIRRIAGFDEKVLSLYARGMTVREIRSHLEEIYQVTISPDVISTVTDAVLDEARLWQQRPLDAVYPVVIFDAMYVKIRTESGVRAKAAYIALGVDRDGSKNILGLWIEENEGATFWLRILSELKTRGIQDILIALVDGLKGFPEAVTTVFKNTQVHRCIVHLVRQSLRYVPWQDKQSVVQALKLIYKAPTAQAAMRELELFEVSELGRKYPMIAEFWRSGWEFIEPTFSYPPEIRALLYTTNAIESLNMQLRKIIKNRGHFPNDDAAFKLLYLAMRNIVATWSRRSNQWVQAMPHLAMVFGNRFINEVAKEG